MTSTLKRALAGAILLTTAVAAAGPALGAGKMLKVFSAEGCECCHLWIAHMKSAGFSVNGEVIDYNRLDTMKQEAGLEPEQTSCHTAFIDGYVIEGHVPAREVERLLAERPNARGLAAPGMPAAAPGMDMGDDPYDVLLIHKDGTSEVYASYR
ncbi:DUF411 domain-containing protein [Consotaella salsifontis]|uniref:Uncharacterized conserved protein n=1 Tax=Consotaella salsifontis TaxID=1365950 RepID=A0A1T4NQ50_9HYPH|nr:DUF411 domain-containing protein [Consotaella salsifontis]SJZ81186.1 Uncharacterized conserved protein [Consotaella salsifontis]